MDIQAKVAELVAAMRAKGHMKADGYVIVNPSYCSVTLNTDKGNSGESAFVSEYGVSSKVFYHGGLLLRDVLEAADAAVAAMNDSLAGGYARELGEVS